MSPIRLLCLLSLALLAACGRESKPFDPFPNSKPVAARPQPAPVKSPWVARKVVPDAVEITGMNVIVAPGETIDQVAARTRVPMGALLAANNFPAASPGVTAGQTLKIPGGRVHSVKPGETGISIARAYGIDWSRVVAMNRLRAPYTLEVGDRLLLPSKQVVAAMTIEQRAAAFRIEIDDLITGAEPAYSTPRTAKASKPRAPVVAALKPLPTLAGPAPKFDWPILGRVLSSYGAKPGGRFNDGVNLSAASGDAVHAAGDGVVAYAGNAVAGFGNLVLIKHADGWISAYGHNSVLLVVRGARVAKGEIIARAGATGAVTEPQLHFELRRGRAPVDPLKVLPARG